MRARSMRGRVRRDGSMRGRIIMTMSEHRQYFTFVDNVEFSLDQNRFCTQK